MKKQIIPIFALAICSGTANATLLTDRTTFESLISIVYQEDFETLGPGTTAITGPITMPTGLTVSSESNDLFSAGPGQSTNPTLAIGSNYPPSDSLFFDLGGDFLAFGADFFQNFGGGSQSGNPISYQLSFYDNGSLLDTITSSVAPNGGSFIGYISIMGVFDRVQVFSLGNSFEVADNVTVGNEGVNVPEPAVFALLGLGIAGLGLRQKKKRE